MAINNVSGAMAAPADYAEKRATTVCWRIFAVVFVLVVINLIDRTALSVAMPTISREFALNPALQGVILSAFFWTYATLQVPGGSMIDKFGPRKLITFSTIAWGAFQTLAGFAPGGITRLATRLGLGVAEAPLFPSGAKLSSAWLSPSERGRGAVLMDSGAPLGAAFGGIIISYLILGLGSWRLAFLAAGLGTLALGVIAWRYLRDDPRQHPRVNAAELAQIEGVAVRGETLSAHAVAAPSRTIRSSIAALLTGRMAWAMINFGLLTWGPSYLAQARGLDLKQMGNATFVIFLAGMAGSLTGGFLADALVRRGLRRALVYKMLLAISGLATLASFMALPMVASPAMAVAILSGTLFFLYWGSLYWSLPTLLAPRRQVGLLGGLMNFAGSSRGIAVPIITGLILQWTGAYLDVLYFFAGCARLYVLATLFIGFPREAR